jgi:hypothetical protein
VAGWRGRYQLARFNPAANTELWSRMTALRSFCYGDLADSICTARLAEGSVAEHVEDLLGKVITTFDVGDEHTAPTVRGPRRRRRGGGGGAGTRPEAASGGDRRSDGADAKVVEATMHALATLFRFERSQAQHTVISQDEGHSEGQRVLQRVRGWITSVPSP